ncbi:MAG TPA: ATP-binding protein [Ohtaekwangia sp.]|uniref:sensor histidine kinase n=1 Tax=Ohtaekwangia sp. TaxID=2066019 RepID=UPI002F91CBA0
MPYYQDNQDPASMKQKVLAGFLLAFVAIILALGITHFSFREMLDTVDELSEPNEKLSILNSVFEEITTLDQLQRAEAIQNPGKPYKTFLNQSKTVSNMIDSLMLLPWDSLQLLRLSSMKEILHQRNKLFFSYLKLKSRYAEKKQFTSRLDTLSTIIEQSQIDTSVVTTQKKTITTFTDSIVQQKEKERSGLAKLFGKKKNTTPIPETHIKVQEELSVKVDTLAFARQNKALEEVERIMQELEANQVSQNKRLQHRELELIHANSLFINRLLNTLHEVENEELQKMRSNNNRAGVLFNQNISRISILVVAFFLIAAILVYFIWMDISKSNYYKEQLEQARDEAEELSKIKERFLANMSHEIRTPLQSIIGFAEQLRTQGGHHKEAAEAIHSSSEHLLHIVNEVLDYSRISSGNFSIVQEPFQLLRLVQEVEDAMRVQADKKSLTFLLDTEQANEYTVVGDPFRLRQILYNLLGNAIKFTSKGYIKLMVKTTEQNNHIACTFEVTDTGVGIRKEDIKRIFNQFEQAGSSVMQQQGGGSGLGLTIVRSLVEAQHGNLEVYSEPESGSTFTVKLTFERAEDIQPVTPLSTEFVTSVPFTGKVILVDDDSMILRLGALILDKHGIANSIYQQAEKLLAQSPDPEVTHILIDIRMPNINGIDLCKALRKKYDASTSFIALTAHVFPQDQQKLLDEGFDKVLSKPFHEYELLSLLGISSAASTASLAEESVLDFSAVRQMTLGDEELFQAVINQFVEETSSDLQLLDEHLQHSNAALLRDVVHKLAGRIGQMGALSLSKKLRDTEHALINGEKVEDLSARIKTLKEEVDRLVKNVRVVVE